MQENAIELLAKSTPRSMDITRQAALRLSGAVLGDEIVDELDVFGLGLLLAVVLDLLPGLVLFLALRVVSIQKMKTESRRQTTKSNMPGSLGGVLFACLNSA